MRNWRFIGRSPVFFFSEVYFFNPLTEEWSDSRTYFRPDRYSVLFDRDAIKRSRNLVKTRKIFISHWDGLINRRGNSRTLQKEKGKA